METEAITELTAEKITDALNDGAGAAANMINNNGNFYLTIIVYLAVISLLIGGLLFARKYLLNRPGGIKSGTYMKIIDRLIISQDKQIVLIEMKNKILIVGVTQQRIETLSEFSKDDFGAVNMEPADAGLNAGNNFMSMLLGKFNFKDGGKNDK